MKPEKQHLIHDLLDPQRDARRDAILSAGDRILFQRRQRRLAGQSLAAVTFLAFTVLSIQRLATRRPPLLSDFPPSAPAAQSLTDAELLALFSDTPVGLVTLENGRKRLVFPRPGDEERFVKRL